jgi:hypothetical protein
MISYFDLIQSDEFRKTLENRLKSNSKNNEYHFPKIFPLLYRYRAFSKYSVEDILNKKLTLTNISEYNDLFDSAIQMSDDEIEYLMRKRIADIEKLNIDKIAKQNLIYADRETLKENQSEYFNLNSFLKIYTCCFTMSNNSVLMWAHYADSNKGFALGYDFNNTSQIRKNTLFPILYTDEPIQMTDLVYDEGRNLADYPQDTAVLSAILHKYSAWQYEQEWRLVTILDCSNDIKFHNKRIQIQNVDNPFAIYFGHNILKNLTYCDEKQKQSATEAILLLKKLLSYMYNHSIKAYIVMPIMGKYNLEPKPINIKGILNFIDTNFKNNEPQNIKDYAITQKMLIEYLNGYHKYLDQ